MPKYLFFSVQTDFEMRRDCANEALDNDGWCETEGKGRGDAKRVHEDAAYAPLRARLRI